MLLHTAEHKKNVFIAHFREVTEPSNEGPPLHPHYQALMSEPAMWVIFLSQPARYSY
jgi:hypothetical protein